MAKSRTRRSSRVATRGVPRARRAISVRGIGQELQPEQPGAAHHDRLQLGHLVELQPGHDAEPVAQGRGQEARPGGGADQGERRQVEPDRARRRALADHQVELVVLHRRIEDLLHRRLQPVDLVDEQHVARLQVGQNGGKVTRALR